MNATSRERANLAPHSLGELRKDVIRCDCVDPPLQADDPLHKGNLNGPVIIVDPNRSENVVPVRRQSPG